MLVVCCVLGDGEGCVGVVCVWCVFECVVGMVVCV